MEPKSFDNHVMDLINKFTYEDFSPDNNLKNIFNKFKEIFYINSPFWRILSENANSFSLEFKKYGENRKKVFLKFVFESRDVSIELKVDDYKGSRSEVSLNLAYSEIWKNHLLLFDPLCKIMKRGLALAEELYNRNGAI